MKNSRPPWNGLDDVVIQFIIRHLVNLSTFSLTHFSVFLFLPLPEFLYIFFTYLHSTFPFISCFPYHSLVYVMTRGFSFSVWLQDIPQVSHMLLLVLPDLLLSRSLTYIGIPLPLSIIPPVSYTIFSLFLHYFYLSQPHGFYFFARAQSFVPCRKIPVSFAVVFCLPCIYVCLSVHFRGFFYEVKYALCWDYFGGNKRQLSQV